MVDINEAVVRDSTMWWVGGPGVEKLKADSASNSNLGLPTLSCSR